MPRMQKQSSPLAKKPWALENLPFCVFLPFDRRPSIQAPSSCVPRAGDVVGEAP